MNAKRNMLFFLSLFVSDMLIWAGGVSEKPLPIVSVADKKTITVWSYWETIKHQEVLTDVCRDYNESQNEVEVCVKYVPFADFKKQLSMGAVTSELPDVVIIDNPDHLAYAAMGVFVDITDEVTTWPGIDQYYDGPLNSCRLNGRFYGIPFGSNCLSLFYNADMLQAAGCEPPATWDALYQVALKTTKGETYGIGFSALQNEEGTFGFLTWLLGAGGTAFQIESPAGIKALTFIRKLSMSGVMPREVINWTQGDVMNQFISGNLAMMINGPWQVPTMRALVPDLNWNVVLLPVGDVPVSVLGGENFGIPCGNNVEEALAFVKYVTRPERIRGYIDKFGYIASRRDIAESQKNSILPVFIEQMAYAQLRGPHPRWPEISDALSSAMNESILGIVSPEDAARKAQQKIEAVVNDR